MGLEQIKVELISSWQGDRGGDGAIAHAAWASTFDVEKLSTKTDDDIRRVVTNVVNLHHDTPKERVWLEFFITCPIFVERQFDKYRMTLQYQDFQIEFLEAPMGRDHVTQNELSGRYRTIPDRPYGLPEDVSNIMKKAREFDTRGYYSEEWNYFLEMQHKVYQHELNILKESEKQGKISNNEYKRAREVLRGFLGTSYLTDMRIVMNLNAFEHIINQRLASDAQMESRVVAYYMLNEVLGAEVAPFAVSNMFATNNWNKLTADLSRMLYPENITKLDSEYSPEGYPSKNKDLAREAQKRLDSEQEAFDRAQKFFKEVKEKLKTK